MGTENNCGFSAAHDGRNVVFADIGPESGDVHTAYIRHAARVALNASLDKLFIMDVVVVVCSGSSFSGSVATIKSYSATVLMHLVYIRLHWD